MLGGVILLGVSAAVGAVRARLQRVGVAGVGALRERLVALRDMAEEVLLVAKAGACLKEESAEQRPKVMWRT